MKKRTLYIMAGLALAVTIVNAAAFIYYPLNVELNVQKPPVYFGLGSNGNGADLWGNVINVTITDANTSLAVQVHPTYQLNYYKNISVIKNQDPNNAYYIMFNVTDAIIDTNVTSAELIITNASSVVLATIDLKQTGLQPATGWIEIDPNETFTVSLEVIITPGTTVTYNTTPTLDDGVAGVRLVYSPQSAETP
ncbi:MAG: hypothetical protein GSR87_00110 [Desulfurococcales archaeon]|nr:hypothetical protein [Desulfurococcales archaeon]